MAQNETRKGLPIGRIIIGLVILGVIGVAATFPLWRPLLVDDVVDEAFPAGFDAMPEEQQEVLVAMNEDEPEMARSVAEAMMEDDTLMDEPMPEMADEASAEPVALASGSFGEYDPVHAGEGTATIFELADGNRVLRFEDFRVTNGPALHVLLTANEPTDIRTRPDEGYLDLGMLKGNVGNQNYEIPADVDISGFNYVVIYCQPFHVNFSFAELSTS